MTFKSSPVSKQTATIALAERHKLQKYISHPVLLDCRCVLEQNPGGAGFMSRSFRQTSLSPAGLFITDSGKLAAFRFLNSNKLFFRCVVDFCFFLSTAPNLCTDVSIFGIMHCFLEMLGLEFILYEIVISVFEFPNTNYALYCNISE